MRSFLMMISPLKNNPALAKILIHKFGPFRDYSYDENNQYTDVFKRGIEEVGQLLKTARGLAHGVLVPHAPHLDINLGVTGREPLNNQPYFRIKRVETDMPVHGNARPAIDALLELLNVINTIRSQDPLNMDEIRARAQARGVSITFDMGWKNFME